MRRSFTALKRGFVFPSEVVEQAKLVVERKKQWGLLAYSRNNSTRIQISPCKRFVLKKGMFTSRIVPKYAVPTLPLSRRFLNYIGIGWYDQWVLQPFVDMKNSKKISNTLADKYKTVRFDIHEENAGLWEGHNVLLDW